MDFQTLNWRDISPETMVSQIIDRPVYVGVYRTDENGDTGDQLGIGLGSLEAIQVVGNDVTVKFHSNTETSVAIQFDSTEAQALITWKNR